MADNPSFAIFGNKASFALEIRLIPGAATGAEPEDFMGSWGEWRLWISNLNMCELRLDTEDGLFETQEVRWYLAPLFAWIVENWMPLLHERRLPPGGGLGDSRPRSARGAYLAMVESAGDDLERFCPWQYWANRHSIRSASAGGILPDVFVQRMGDDLEFSWGDRVQPGAMAASFVVEDGLARASVDSVAECLRSALQWFLLQEQFSEAPWMHELRQRWEEMGHGHGPAGPSALSWYLDSSPEPGGLMKKFLGALDGLNRQLTLAADPWLGRLSPEIAMFGDLSPEISSDAAAILLGEYFNARSNAEHEDLLSELSRDIPAWAASSPWHDGYALARDVLDEIDPEPDASMTHLDRMLEMLGVRVRKVNLGERGPRGVALAGDDLRPTILINLDDVRNSSRGGRRFTLAHELCHILFDRSSARALAHSSTPWASPSVEQRANAFAAMLLMPPSRTDLPLEMALEELKQAVNRLADKLKVGRVALKRHLANINQISADELQWLMGAQSHDL